MVKRPIQQFENHPNRDSLVKDLNKTEEFNPFCEKSKELIASMGDTEYFELCEISSKIRCPNCSLCWEACIVYCTCGKCIQPSGKNNERYDVLSIPSYIVKQNPTHGARHGTPMRQCMYYKAHAMLKTARKHRSGGYEHILDRWHTDDKHRKSLSDIGWTEEQIIQYDEIALEDHFYDKKEVGTRCHGNCLWMQKVFKDHWISAVTLKKWSKHAKYCSKNTQRSLEVGTNLSLQGNKWDNGLINHLKALKNRITDLKLPLDGDTISLPRRIHLRHHDGQPSSGLWSIWSWDSWNSSSWTEQ